MIVIIFIVMSGIWYIVTLDSFLTLCTENGQKKPVQNFNEQIKYRFVKLVAIFVFVIFGNTINAAEPILLM